MAFYGNPSYEPSVLWDKIRCYFEINMRMDLLICPVMEMNGNAR